MPFVTNKIDQNLPDRLGENAKRLEDLLNAVNWPRLIRTAVWLHVSLLLFLFTVIVVVRFALSIF